MRIIVVGGKGFIGKPLAENLGKFHDVVVWDLPEVDVRDRHLLKERCVVERPEVIVNLAGVLGGTASQNVHEIFDVNFVGNLNLLEVCRINGIKNFVFSSSLTVHGQNDPSSPNIISSPLRPIHAYGASKAASEFALQEYAKRFGMKTVAVRPTLVLGDTTLLHAPIEFIRSALAGEDIVVYGDGRHEREWLWVDDAVQGFVRAVEFCLAAAPGFYPFFLSGNRITMKDLALRCAAPFNGRVKFIGKEAKAFTLTSDTTESDRMLGWQATIGIDEMIQKLVTYEKLAK